MFDVFGKLFGDIDPDLGAGVNPSSSRYKYFADMAGAVLNLVMYIGFAISIIAVAYSFILYIMSAGNPEKIKTAWNAFLYSVIGAAISIGIFALRAIILRVFGASESYINPILPGF